MIRKVIDSGGKDDGSKNIFEGLFAEYFDLATLTLLLNLPFLAIGCRSLGTKFIARSGFSMVAFSLFLETFAPMRNATDEYLLAVCFGGIFLGVGVGLVISFGGCLDGTETVAILLNRRFDLPVGRSVLIFNIVIYMIAGFLFGFDRAMYSLLTYYITSHVLDFVEGGADQAKAATIITDEGRQIAGLIYRRMGRTVTILEGEGLISGRKSVVYCVQNRFEVYELKKLIKEVDGSAFIAITAFATMAGIGGSSYMSICMGRSDRETAQKTINNALLMLAVISAVVTAAVLCFKRPFLITVFDNMILIFPNMQLRRYGGDALGDTYIACSAVVQSFMVIVNSPGLGITSGCGTLFSYHYGAGNYCKVMQCFRSVFALCLVYMLVLLEISQTAAAPFVRLFLRDPQQIGLKSDFISRYTLGPPGVAVQLALVDGLTAMGRVRQAMPLSLFRKGVYIARVFLLPVFLELKYIFYAGTIADVVGSLFTAAVFLTIERRKLKAEL